MIRSIALLVSLAASAVASMQAADQLPPSGAWDVFEPAPATSDAPVFNVFEPTTKEQRQDLETLNEIEPFNVFDCDDATATIVAKVVEIPTTSRNNPPVDSRPIVRAYGTDNCPACERIKTMFAGAECPVKLDWRTPPSWVTAYPTLHVETPGKRWVKFEGITSPDAVIKAIRGPHWTNPGDIRTHLLNEHRIPAHRLEGLTQEQLRAIHDAIHEQGTASTATPPAATIQPASWQRSQAATPQVKRMSRLYPRSVGGVAEFARDRASELAANYRWDEMDRRQVRQARREMTRQVVRESVQTFGFGLALLLPLILAAIRLVLALLGVPV